jgi:hypothetical protein
MNIPTSILKSNYLPPEKVQLHQKLAKNYNKQISKYKIFQTKSNKNQLKDEIISWLFSFDIITRIILSSVENKWLTSMLHQLYLQQKSNHKLRFLYRFEEPLAEMIPQFLPQNIIINQVNNNSDNLSFVNYFQWKDDNRVTHEKGIVENVFLQKDIHFYKTEDSNLSDNMAPCHKYSYYFSLSSRAIEEEGFFRKMFDTFSGGQAFTNVVPCDYDSKAKAYVFGLPTWMNSKEYYSLTEYFIAFLEQAITMRYFLFKNNTDIDTEMNGIYLTKLFNERQDLSGFIKKEYKVDGVKLCEALGVKGLIDDVRNDYRIKEIISSRMKGQEMISFNGIMYNNFVLYENDLLTSYELDKKLKQYFNAFKSEDDLMDSLIFSNFENIFTMEDFLMKRIYENLVDNYAHKNAYDLINGIYEKDSLKKRTKKTKKKKKSNDNSDINKPLLDKSERAYIEFNNLEHENLASNAIDINTSDGVNDNGISIINNNYVCPELNGGENDEAKSCFPFIKRNIKKESTDFKRGEFMGDMMMVRSSNASQEGQQQFEDEELKPFIIEIINGILENVYNHQAETTTNDAIADTTPEGSETNLNDLKKNDDKDTAYSSAYLSDNTSKCKDNEAFPRKKKARNNYKLYDFKLKEKKENKKLDTNKPNSIKSEKETPTDLIKRDRIQSTNTYPTKALSLDIASVTKFPSQSSTPVKGNTTSSFQININSNEFDIKKTFKKHDSFSYQYPHNANYYFKSPSYHSGMRYYYDVPMMNNFYYFNGHNSFNELFFFRFQKYIINYTDQVENNMNSLKETKNNIISKLVGIIKDCLSIVLLT